MADEEQLKILKGGVSGWNTWRGENSVVRPNLVDADLAEADLSGANLGGANLCGANLSVAQNLTKGQIASALGNEQTKRPAGLAMPDHWKSDKP